MTGGDIFRKMVAPYLKTWMRSGAPARGVLKKKVYEMPGVHFRPLKYMKRTKADRKSCDVSSTTVDATRRRCPHHHP